MAVLFPEANVIRHLKSPISQALVDDADSKVRAAVEHMLHSISTGGDSAVRGFSSKLDHWSPADFRLSRGDIKECYAQLPRQALDDIGFAQAQVRRFAQLQRATLQDLEVETLPGVILGHKHIPVNSVGCYVPGGKYPLVASAHMSVVTAKVAGVPRVIAAAPPFHDRHREHQAGRHDRRTR